MQSALQFTEALDEEPVQKQNCDLKGIHPFRNMPDRRERTVFTNVVPKSDRTTVKRFSHRAHIRLQQVRNFMPGPEFTLLFPSGIFNQKTLPKLALPIE